jgi:hypothetical protein
MSCWDVFTTCGAGTQLQLAGLREQVQSPTVVGGIDRQRDPRAVGKLAQGVVAGRVDAGGRADDIEERHDVRAVVPVERLQVRAVLEEVEGDLVGAHHVVGLDDVDDVRDVQRPALRLQLLGGQVERPVVGRGVGGDHRDRPLVATRTTGETTSDRGQPEHAGRNQRDTDTERTRILRTSRMHTYHIMDISRAAPTPMILNPCDSGRLSYHRRIVRTIPAIALAIWTFRRCAAGRQTRP